MLVNYEKLKEENYKRRDGHRKVRMKKKQALCSKGQKETAQYSDKWIIFSFQILMQMNIIAIKIFK